MKRYLTLGLLCLLTKIVIAQEYNNIEYLCCDWGPTMTLPTKTKEVAQFNDAEDEVYFLKQIYSFTRKKQLMKEIFNGRDYEDIGKGLSIYLCKMKADGSDKTEIKELWKSPGYSIDTQDQSTWMDVNRKTHKIALSITYAGSDITGLWTMNLDGKDLKRIITPGRNKNYLQAINHVSWSPDGRWLFFEEQLRGMNPNRFNIAKCDASGAEFARVFEATEKIQYKEPTVSPDGRQLAFSRYPRGYPGSRFIWIASLDGTNAAPLGGKDSPQNCGSYPAWSPDGKRIYLKGGDSMIVDVVAGRQLLERRPMLQGRRGSCGWPHWGRAAFVGFNVGGILVTDLDLKEARWAGSSKLVKRTDGYEAFIW